MTDVHDKKTRSFTPLEIMFFCMMMRANALIEFLIEFNMSGAGEIGVDERTYSC